MGRKAYYRLPHICTSLASTIAIIGIETVRDTEWVEMLSITISAALPSGCGWETHEVIREAQRRIKLNRDRQPAAAVGAGAQDGQRLVVSDHPAGTEGGAS